jgi:serine/threonine-protein kinase
VTARTGQVLGGRYEITKVIGRGGQSTVYRARDRVDGDEVAIKLVHGALGDPDATERIFREAQSMSQLIGTSAVRILHQVHTDDGALGLVMELLEGRDLEAHLRELEARRERPSLAWVESTFTPIVQTLATAHDRGLVHRDLKAENIFLLDEARGGGVRLLDFGFVKLLRSPKITGSEVLAGSPQYIAPETFLHGAAMVDVRADVYSLSVILFRAIAGTMPFHGETVMELMVAVTTGERPRLHTLRPDFSPDVDAWVQQALAVNPDDRFQSIHGTWRALRNCFPGA